jgi:hypothetical protein
LPCKQHRLAAAHIRSAENREKLDREIDAMPAEPRFTACLGGLGATVLAGSPSDVGKLIADETEKLAKVIRANNIKAE